MTTRTALLIIGAIILFAFLVFQWGGPKNSPTSSVSTSPNSNVSIVNGQQIIEIKAKGGYRPQVSEAKAGIPTVIRFQTKGTYDCSAVIRIPSLGIDQDLPPNGATDVTVGVLSAGVLQGTCGMGMYRFTINVKG